ncbi:MAG TPA: adenosylmethionine decarboxylase [Burkholderiales bacterium]|jgi:S-adenosylmethionine decarboxylase|nr:adenosylmethionine decarboxylase [Burkholderiales bacterium]
MLLRASARAPQRAALGFHLIGDLYGCKWDKRQFTDAEHLRAHCLELVRSAGLTAIGDCFHQFGEEGGVTGVVVLAESHLSIHTWPERLYVTIDVYVCNYTSDNKAKAQALFDRLVKAYEPKDLRFHALDRG